MGSLDQLYQQVILDHAREKHGEGDPSGLEASSHQVNPTCGDEVTLGVTLDGAPGLVRAARRDGQVRYRYFHRGRARRAVKEQL